MTQLESARNGILTKELLEVAADEKIDPEKLRQSVAAGHVAIPANLNHTDRRYFGIGEKLRVKTNANIGTSPRNSSVDHELIKLQIAEELNAESVMDLSISGDLDHIRQTIIDNSSIMVGTVPIYQVMVEHTDGIDEIGIKDMLEIIDLHGRQGVDFITIHCSLTREALPLLKRRLMGIVSRGGSFISRWMKTHGRENPLYEYFDDILDIARKYDMTLSLGDGLRPGAVADAGDEAQFHELRVSGELVKRSRRAGVQVIVEGPGHVPLNQIEYNMRLQQEVCDDAPFYVLGPLVTDVAPGYDHIVGAIGGTLAAYYGASFLCYVTPSEHLRLPSIEDVREGIIASKIAAHSADIARSNEGAFTWDEHFSRMRRRFDWEGMFNSAIDSRKPREYRENSTNFHTEECSMCGKYCAIKIAAIKEKSGDRE